MPRYLIEFFCWLYCRGQRKPTKTFPTTTLLSLEPVRMLRVQSQHRNSARRQKMQTQMVCLCLAVVMLRLLAAQRAKAGFLHTKTAGQENCWCSWCRCPLSLEHDPKHYSKCPSQIIQWRYDICHFHLLVACLTRNVCIVSVELSCLLKK